MVFSECDARDLIVFMIPFVCELIELNKWKMKQKLMEAAVRSNWGSIETYLLPFKPSTFKIPIDKYVKTLLTGYNTTKSHATGLTYRHTTQTL